MHNGHFSVILTHFFGKISPKPRKDENVKSLRQQPRRTTDKF